MNAGIFIFDFEIQCLEVQKARIYRGIEFIRISDLPEDEQHQIKQIQSTDLVIKILTDNGLFRDCVSYKDYTHWYNNIYTKVSPATDKDTEEVKPQAPAPKVGFLTRLKNGLLPDT